MEGLQPSGWKYHVILICRKAKVKSLKDIMSANRVRFEPQKVEL
jgi:hypothetical protein